MKARDQAGAGRASATEVTAEGWDAWLKQRPAAHILQDGNWGRLKAQFGWQPAWVAGEDCGAQVLLRKLPLGLKIAYIPKGPVGQQWQALWPALDTLCHRERAIFLRIEPDLWEGEGGVDLQHLERYANQSAPSIQPRRTIVLSLLGSETDWLARMKQKTRYNIRLAERKGVTVAESSDLDAFVALMELTGRRDAFGVHTSNYYREAYRLFRNNGSAALWMAYYGAKPLAGVMGFRRGSRAWFLFGGSSDEERNRMPAYLAQWAVICWAAQNGCTEYDLWGAPDHDEAELEAGFETRTDGLWQVYRFKRGFGGVLRRSVGAWDRVYHPGLYRIYQWLITRRQSPMQ